MCTERDLGERRLFWSDALACKSLIRTHHEREEEKICEPLFPILARQGEEEEEEEEPIRSAHVRQSSVQKDGHTSISRTYSARRHTKRLFSPWGCLPLPPLSSGQTRRRRRRAQGRGIFFPRAHTSEEIRPFFLPPKNACANGRKTEQKIVKSGA